MQVMTRAEQLEKEYDELTEKQATVIKDRDALKQVRPLPHPTPATARSMAWIKLVFHATPCMTTHELHRCNLVAIELVLARYMNSQK